MVWLYCSPIPVGELGGGGGRVISRFKWFLPAFPCVEEWGVGIGTLWGSLGLGEKGLSLKPKISLWLKRTCLPSGPRLMARAVCSWVWAGIMPTSGSPAIGSARAGRPFSRPGFEPPFYKTEFHTGRFWISSRQSTKKGSHLCLKIE